MQGLQFGKYTFECRLDAPAILPAYKGSTFRGVFGLALKKVVCALKHQICDQCPLRHQCLYTTVFETPLAIEPPKGLRVSATPHPFVLEPSAKPDRNFSPGDTLECDLLLFGDVNQSLPYFVYAFEQTGKIGIGKRINGRRANFTIETVKTGSDVIFNKNDQQINQPQETDALTLTSSADQPQDVFRVTVRLQTPLRLKHDNRIKADLPFHILLRAMLRRVSSLFACYVGNEPALDYKGMIQRAGSITTVASDLHWHGWQRYSNRQKQRMPLGGVVGSVTYEGAFAEYLPLMDICSKVHIGKNTSFGLGKIDFDLTTQL